jgi:hypothetical protein
MSNVKQNKYSFDSVVPCLTSLNILSTKWLDKHPILFLRTSWDRYYGRNVSLRVFCWWSSLVLLLERTSVLFWYIWHDLPLNTMYPKGQEQHQNILCYRWCWFSVKYDSLCQSEAVSTYYILFNIVYYIWCLFSFISFFFFILYLNLEN